MKSDKNVVSWRLRYGRRHILPLPGYGLEQSQIIVQIIAYRLAQRAPLNR